MSRPGSYYDYSDQPPPSSSFTIPVASTSASTLGSPIHQHSSSFSQIPASSTRNYRHSSLVESGDYRYDAAMSPSRSNYAAGTGVGQDYDGAGGNARQSRQLNRMPVSDHASGASASFGSSSGAGVGRSVSISGLGGGSAQGGPRGSSLTGQRMSYSPNLPLNQNLAAFTWSDAQQQLPAQQHYRASPAAAAVPGQSGVMRRGMSYDGGYGGTSPIQPIHPQLQPQQPPPPSSLTHSGSLLPTAYSGRTPSGYSSPMTGVQRNSGEFGSISPAGFALPHSPAVGSSQYYGQPNQGLGIGQPSTSTAVDHIRHASYSPSHYAAISQSGPPSNPPPSLTSTASFYAHHIPSTSSISPRPPASPLMDPSTSNSNIMAHHPQAQQYYQSQQYFDSNLPVLGNPSLVPVSAAQYYAGGQELRTVSAQSRAASGAGRGFKKVRDVRDIPRNINVQPPGRRASPTGGFLSPIKSLTTHLPQTYYLVNPNFRYETSLNPRRVLTKPSKPVNNDGFDNEDSDYILYVNDVLGPPEKARYLILDVLGQGTFGQVVKCQNMKTHEIVAVKVVKNKPAYFQQSMMEVTILELINNTWDKDDKHHMLRLKDTFIHHSHLCLVFELLSNNLYELIKQNSFRGLSTSLVRVFTSQLLDALTVLQEAKIIHCDLKPENILLKSLQSPTIKVIDFGSACHEKQTVYTYIQSRFYRSPEIILSLPYSASIDMWSLGCICVELFLGLPLFPGTSEFNQITRIVEMLGPLPETMLEKGKQSSHFFESVADDYGRRRWRLKSLERFSAEFKVQEQPSKKYFAATTLPEIIKQYPIVRKGLKEADVEKEMRNRVAFIDFVQGLLHLDPDLRWSPQQARLHPFVLGEPLLQPFVPPPHLKGGGVFGGKVVPPSPQPEAKRYGGLPPAPQRNAPRTYDAKAYNQHLNQQQGYTVQAQQAAQRAAQVPTNPYHQAELSPQTGYSSLPPRAGASGTQVQQQQFQPQQSGSYNSSFDYSRQGSNRQSIGSGSLANPPPVHHYTTRGRSNTATEIPPALKKLGQELGVPPGSGQSITPVLRRDDWESWQMANNDGVQRRVSTSRNPHLSLLQDQAESGVSWQSPMRPRQGSQQPNASAYYHSPTNQGFSVVVDQRLNDPFDAGIAAPPQAYSSSNPNRYSAYTLGSLPPQQSSHSQQQYPSLHTQGPYDQYEQQRDGLASGYSQNNNVQSFAQSPRLGPGSQQQSPTTSQQPSFAPPAPKDLFGR